MGKMDEFATLDATTMAELVRNREVSPIDLVDAAIARIECFNPALNAVITPMFDQARTVAQQKLPTGPFTGVPFLLKDLGAPFAGVRMALGTAFMTKFIPDHDSELVIRLKKSGLIILGKTNTPELGLLPTTEPRFFGPSRNPWNTGRTTGGSSGGSAAAVAARFVPFAHANDGGGSIRVPASCCGVFGLKPTRARIPQGPDFGDQFSGLIIDHAVTGSVRDSAALLDATAGPDIGDPYWAPTPARPFLQEVGVNPGRLRIAISTKPSTATTVHADCVNAAHDAASLCASLGHEVEEAFPAVNADIVTNCFQIMWSAGCAWAIEGMALATRRKPTQDEFEPFTWALYEMGKKQTASTYLLALSMLQRISRIIAGFFLKYDMVLTPTLAEPPVALGAFDFPENPIQAFMRAVAFTPFTALCNVTGQPAMSVPLYWNTEGLPIGTHFVGRFGDEATLFRLAAQLETARPWTGRRPTLKS